MSTVEITAGLNNPGHQSQQIFRQVLKVMSEPGLVEQLPELESLPPLDNACYGLILSLLDQSTPLLLSAEFNQPSVRQNLSFHTGVPFTDVAAEAAFVLAFAGEIDSLTAYNKGSAEYPETGASLILRVNGINNGCGTTMTLSGPGIPGQRLLQLDGISDTLCQYLTERPDEFPSGIDLLICCGNQLVCIPRSTQVTLAKEAH